MISVIVPVYNCEKFVARCIESILDQTYRDLELLIVNDGSTDGSAAIIQQYAAKDSRIRYFEQANQGVSVARNRGIDEAKGDYIHFVDADDWLDEDCLETLCDTAEKDDLDCVSYGFRFVYEDGRPNKEDRCGDSAYYYCLKNEKEAVDFLEKAGRAVFYTSCQHLFRLQIIKTKHIAFMPGIQCGEDRCFAYFFALSMTKGCILRNYAGYNYYQHKDSCVHVKDDPWFTAVDEKIRICKAAEKFWLMQRKNIYTSPFMAFLFWDLILHLEITMQHSYDLENYNRFNRSNMIASKALKTILLSAPMRRKILTIIRLVSRSLFCRCISI